MESLYLNRLGNLNIPKKIIQEKSIYEKGKAFAVMTWEEYFDSVKSQTKGAMIIVPFDEFAATHINEHENDDIEETKGTDDIPF